MRIWVLLFVCITCVMGVCNDDSKTRNTYIYYSLNGATCNGEFTIEGIQDNGLLEATALLVPASDDTPEVVILTFYDYALNREVAFTLPVGNGVSNPFQLEYGSDFGMGIIHTDDEWLLTSGVENTIYGVSIDVKKFKKGSGFFGFGSVEEFDVAFEGIMTFENEMNEVEQHTVKGDFYYREQL